MSEPNDITQQNGETPFEPERLLSDLKAMPRVSAPMDFSYHLSEAIAALDAEKPAPWWKRFFLPAIEGGFRIPALAYGGVTALVVLSVSVYVFNVTDFDRELQQQLDPRSTEQEMIPERDLPPGETPGGSDHRPASPSAAPVESDADDRRDQADTPSESKVESPTTAPTLPEKTENDVQDAGRSPVPAVAEPQSKSTGEKEYRVRGLLDMDLELRLSDSLANDSLRRLDSLRKLQSDKSAPSPSEPR
jgi:hypothetical protein